MKNKKSTKSGFTIVEVSIATAFISVLMIVISVVIINVVTIYQKGTVIKNLNSVGRNIVDDVTGAIEAALPASTISDDSGNEIYRWRQGYYRKDDNSISVQDSSETQAGSIGVFCPGYYSYIWDTAGEARLKYGDNVYVDNIRLLKVKDESHTVCLNYIPGEKLISIGVDLSSNPPEELLANNEIDFRVISFDVTTVNGKNGDNQVVSNTSEVFFSGSITLGTARGAKDVVDGDNSLSNCRADDADYNYCAINKFKFAARTAGKVFK